MRIHIPNTYLIVGQPIEGTITLELKEPIKGSEVSASLISKEQRTNTKGQRSTHDKYWETLTLDNAKEYPANQKLEYPFKFKSPFPADLEPRYPFKILGHELNFAKENHNFRVEAKLDISLGIDISAKQEITIAFR
jgi:hypothetical protein